MCVRACANERVFYIQLRPGKWILYVLKFMTRFFGIWIIHEYIVLELECSNSHLAKWKRMSEKNSIVFCYILPFNFKDNLLMYTNNNNKMDKFATYSIPYKRTCTHTTFEQHPCHNQTNGKLFIQMFGIISFVVQKKNAAGKLEFTIIGLTRLSCPTTTTPVCVWARL